MVPGVAVALRFVACNINKYNISIVTITLVFLLWHRKVQRQTYCSQLGIYQCYKITVHVI